MTQDEVNYSFAARDDLWPFKILNVEGITIGSMQGRASWIRNVELPERSDISKGFLISSYTFTGAYIGSSYPPYGTIIGGAIGFIIGVAAVLLE